jgi:N6-L-threonylcarbamoyladenine synthase
MFPESHFFLISDMLVLGIESSCDETAAAVVELNGSSTPTADKTRILSSFVASQDEVHARYGGVVPELASRRHLETIVPLVRCAAAEANITIRDIDGIAVTYAPGLLGSLLVGIQMAKGLCIAARKPMIGVNHLEGHLNAILLERPDIPYPHVGLVVSGGHTSLYLVKEFGDYKLLGSTRDDAAGEAFDKVAKLLNLGYPGGPVIDRLSKKGDAHAFKFPVPHFGYWTKKNETMLDFSFSGIKTAVLLKYRKAAAEGSVNDQFIRDMAASFQNTIVRVLCGRVLSAVKQTKSQAVVLSGGVASNSHLRDSLKQRCLEEKIDCFIPSAHYCTDNAAMIARVGGEYLKRGVRSDMSLNAVANQEIGL